MSLRQVSGDNLPVICPVRFGFCLRPGQIEISLAFYLISILQPHSPGEDSVTTKIDAVSVLPEDGLWHGIKDLLEHGPALKELLFSSLILSDVPGQTQQRNNLVLGVAQRSAISSQTCCR
jgi:hypothetical protein